MTSFDGAGRKNSCGSTPMQLWTALPTPVQELNSYKNPISQILAAASAALNSVVQSYSGRRPAAKQAWYASGAWPIAGAVNPQTLSLFPLLLALSSASCLLPFHLPPHLSLPMSPPLSARISPLLYFRFSLCHCPVDTLQTPPSTRPCRKSSRAESPTGSGRRTVQRMAASGCGCANLQFRAGHPRFGVRVVTLDQLSES